MTGIGKGETLRAIGDGQVLPMMLAFFHRDAMVETLMREIDNVTDDILPLAERNKRIAELEVEIDAQTAPSLRPRRGHR